MNLSKFNGIETLIRTRKSRKLILRHFRLFALVLTSLVLNSRCSSGQQHAPENPIAEPLLKAKIETGAEQMAEVLEHCRGQKVGLVANQTSVVNGVHLLDTLLASDVNVVRVFGPEHGFRGNAADGEKVSSDIDPTTGIPIISLYGDNKKPQPNQIADLDLLLFDIQDVGARFYTYISTLHLVMEAAAEQGVGVLVLDRPNPNGHYVDGPVLKPGFSSFVGMHPVPVVHGMTVGEYARMINGEQWLKDGKRCELDVVECENYSHQRKYKLPVAPSPNLPNMTSVYLYPSLAFFEGTNVSVGRGTEFPFQQIGMPNFKGGDHTFTPHSIPGVSKYPPHEGVKCVGFDLRKGNYAGMEKLELKWLLDMYREAPNQGSFFLESGFFNKLAGTDQLMEQIIAGWTEAKIRKSWEKDLDAFKQTRKKYLLYPDFE